MSQVLFLILRTVLEGIKRKIKREIAEEQYGCVEGKGMRSAIFTLRMLSERKYRDTKRNVFVLHRL